MRWRDSSRRGCSTPSIRCAPGPRASRSRATSPSWSTGSRPRAPAVGTRERLFAVGARRAASASRHAIRMRGCACCSSCACSPRSVCGRSCGVVCAAARRRGAARGAGGAALPRRRGRAAVSRLRRRRRRRRRGPSRHAARARAGTAAAARSPRSARARCRRPRARRRRCCRASCVSTSASSCAASRSSTRSLSDFPVACIGLTRRGGSRSCRPYETRRSPAARYAGTGGPSSVPDVGRARSDRDAGPTQCGVRPAAHGRRRLALRAARLHLAVERDLRRHQRLLGLRPARRRAQEQPEGALVAARRARARRRRGHRLVDHRAPAHLGGLGPRRALQRSDGRLPGVQEALPRRSARRRRPVSGARGNLAARLDRGAQLQPDAQDLHRRPGGRCGDGVPARRDLPVDLPRLRSASARARARRSRSASRRSARRFATRSIRATSRSARASSSRRSSSSSVTPRSARSGSSTGSASASRSITRSASARRGCACGRTRPDELAHYANAAADIEFLLPVRLAGDRGRPRSRRLGSARHSEFSGKDLSVTDEETKERYLPW